MTVPEKIRLLREQMAKEKIDACIIPCTDPHMSEHPASHWKSREWISGFTGSAGTIAITSNKVGLWTDSRYFLQAEEQLTNSGIQLFKSGLPETTELKNWLCKELEAKAIIGIDGSVLSAAEFIDMSSFFAKKDITLRPDFMPFDIIWKDRPNIPENKLFIFPESIAGADVTQKISKTLDALHQEGANTTIISSLDTIAWLFNIRGNDVDYNPVVISHAFISDNETVLFIDPKKLNSETAGELKKKGIILAEYNKITGFIKNLTNNKLLIVPSKINSCLYKTIPKSCTIIQAAFHPADILKSIKNETEIAGFRNAMKKDGVALVKFQMWLEKSLNEGNKITELDVSLKLQEYRSEQPLSFGESFETIAGYAAHGAIVHYSATEKSNAAILPEGLLLVDSGAQYFDGTTDITRTYAVGPVSDSMKSDYTSVLKGHINLACAKFPKGTKGVQLDILARKALWENGVNYLHGTGHGVGHFLNVHEGPQSIRMEYNPTAMLPGMITSNEPGIYRTNEYGIRIENLILTVPFKANDSSEFYQFETLTLCPIDKKPINKSLLSESEIDWLNAYHRKVYDTLSPELTEIEQIWLKEKTNEI